MFFLLFDFVPPLYFSLAPTSTIVSRTLGLAHLDKIKGVGVGGTGTVSLLEVHCFDMGGGGNWTEISFWQGCVRTTYRSTYHLVLVLVYDILVVLQTGRVL